MEERGQGAEGTKCVQNTWETFPNWHVILRAEAGEYHSIVECLPSRC